MDDLPPSVTVWPGAAAGLRVQHLEFWRLAGSSRALFGDGDSDAEGARAVPPVPFSAGGFATGGGERGFLFPTNEPTDAPT